MTIDQAFSQAMTWLKRIVALCFLLVLAVTAVEILGFNVPGIAKLSLDQGTGIALAGIGFLLSKL